MVQDHKVLRYTALLTCVFESFACLALHVIPLRRGTIIFHHFLELPILTPIVSAPSGPTILLWI
jgi:hypothetical protein